MDNRPPLHLNRALNKSYLSEQAKSLLHIQYYVHSRTILGKKDQAISSIIRCAVRRPETMAVGRPVPGRVLAPVK